MRILLIGEYSGLHNSLKEGLEKNGHEVTLVGSGDGFKKYPMDIKIESTIFEFPLLKTLAKLIDKIFRISLNEIEIWLKTKMILHKLVGYDVVQLVNENAFRTIPSLQISLLKYILNNNKKLFLLSCGTDYKSVKHSIDKKFRYSILTPLLNNKNLKKLYKPILKYLTKDYIKLHDFLLKNINGIISSDLDYHIPYIGDDKYLGMIPNPINIEKNNFNQLKINNRIKIFHGINKKNYVKKGNKYFEKAMEVIQSKYKDKIEYIKSIDIPHKDYLNHYQNCHILLDQVYAYDQGYNALEAMSKGKVVFTGAEKEWLEYYNVEEDKIAINALPNVNYIVSKIEWLINNPNELKLISKNAREFIEKYHHYINVAKEYENIWSKN